MADKKCPKCSLWNSEKAEICDCGYNFVLNQSQYSIKKEEDYRKLFQDYKINENNINHFHRNVLLRNFLSLTIIYLSNLPFRINMLHTCCVSSLILFLIIFINLFSGNKYIEFILRRMWKYPVSGLLLGWLLGFILEIIIGIINNTVYINYYPHIIIFILSIMYIFSLIGLFVGKKKVIDESKIYFDHLQTLAQPAAAADLAKAPKENTGLRF